MKNLLGVILLLWVQNLLATDVNFSLKDARLGTANFANRTVWIQYLSAPSSYGPSTINYSKIITNSDAQGIFSMPTMVPGLYSMAIQAPPDSSTTYFVVLADNLGTINAADYVVLKTSNQYVWANTLNKLTSSNGSVTIYPSSGVGVVDLAAVGQATNVYLIAGTNTTIVTNGPATWTISSTGGTGSGVTNNTQLPGFSGATNFTGTGVFSGILKAQFPNTSNAIYLNPASVTEIGFNDAIEQVWFKQPPILDGSSVTNLQVANIIAGGSSTSNQWNGKFVGDISAATNLTFISKSAFGTGLSNSMATITPEQFGGAGDDVLLTNVSITSGQAIITCSTANFTAADVGKGVCLYLDATNQTYLKTTILSRQSTTQVTLAAPSTKTWTANGWMHYGTDNTPAVRLALNYFYTNFASGIGRGGTVQFGPGTYGFYGTLVTNANLDIQDASILAPIAPSLTDTSNSTYSVTLAGCLKRGTEYEPIAGPSSYSGTVLFSCATHPSDTAYNHFYYFFSCNNSLHNYNGLNVTIQDLNIKQPVNPPIGYINNVAGGGLIVEGVTIDQDFPPGFYGPTPQAFWFIPTGQWGAGANAQASVGIMLPGSFNPARSVIRDTLIFGCGTGIQLASSVHATLERVGIHVCNEAIMMGCTNINFVSGAGVCGGYRIHPLGCRYGVVAPASVGGFQIDWHAYSPEGYPLGTPPEVAQWSDPSSAICGTIVYQPVTGHPITNFAPCLEATDTEFGTKNRLLLATPDGISGTLIQPIANDWLQIVSRFYHKAVLSLTNWSATAWGWVPGNTNNASVWMGTPSDAWSEIWGTNIYARNGLTVSVAQTNNFLTANQLIASGANKQMADVFIGAGLTLGGSPLTLSGTGGAGGWGNLADKGTNETALGYFVFVNPTNSNNGTNWTFFTGTNWYWQNVGTNGGGDYKTNSFLFGNGSTSNVLQILNPSGQTIIIGNTNGVWRFGTNNQVVIDTSGNITLAGQINGSLGGATAGSLPLSALPQIAAYSVIGNPNAGNSTPSAVGVAASGGVLDAVGSLFGGLAIRGAGFWTNSGASALTALLSSANITNNVNANTYGFTNSITGYGVAPGSFINWGIANGTSNTIGTVNGSNDLYIAVGNNNILVFTNQGLTIPTTVNMTNQNFSTGLVHADSNGKLTSSLVVAADAPSFVVTNDSRALTLSGTNYWHGNNVWDGGQLIFSNNVAVDAGNLNVTNGVIQATNTSAASQGITLNPTLNYSTFSGGSVGIGTGGITNAFAAQWSYLNLQFSTNCGWGGVQSNGTANSTLTLKGFEEAVFSMGNTIVQLGDATTNLGHHVSITCGSTGTNAITTVSSQKIGGQTKWTNSVIYGCTMLISDGSNWQICGSRGN